MNTIINQFSDKIRDFIPKDGVIQSTGVAGFIQAVLVPELTMMLVKEDMKVNDETARQIIRDSTEIGELLNEQPNDEIHVKFQEQCR